MAMPAPSDRAVAPGNGRAARRRRRALYAPAPRLTRLSPLSGRLLWHIGDWGRASEHIGNRWEAFATQGVGAHLEPGSHLIVLGADPELMGEVLSTGLPHADALQGRAVRGALGLEPVDFKWSLETAQVKQVSASTLERLLESRLPRLERELDRARAALRLPPEASVQAWDGRFLAPEHPANRAALRLDPALPALLVPVDARAFFEPLPGWPAARALARLEGVSRARLHAVEALERYYRLGAGVAGALTRLRAGLFDETPPAVDAEAALDTLRASRAGLTINQVLLDLERQLAARRALDERLALLPRAAYPFSRLRADLARAGPPPAVLDSRGALGRLYAEVTRQVAEAVRSAGRDLVASGLSDEEALDRLAAEGPRWARLARRHARAAATQR